MAKRTFREESTCGNCSRAADLHYDSGDRGRRAQRGRLWYDTPHNAISYAMHSSRSHDAVIRVYDGAGNVIETHEHNGDFKEW